MSLSLFDALRLAGLDELISWEPWHEMLALGLTTWAEDTVSNRSDCHAWGSVPLQQFPRYVLGVRPSEPGFDAVTIDPVPSDLEHAEGPFLPGTARSTSGGTRPTRTPGGCRYGCHRASGSN